MEKDGLALNIDADDNALDLDLAIGVGEYFRLGEDDMNQIIEEILSVISNWKHYAKKIGIAQKEQLIMEPAFNVEL